MVYRASVLALDLLECRALRSVDDALRLFRNSAQTRRGSEAQLARVHLLQHRFGSDLWSSRSRRAAVLVALRHNRRHACGRSLPGGGGVGETARTAEPNPEAWLSEYSEHHHPGAVHFCVQVRPPGYDRARARVPG